MRARVLFAVVLLFVGAHQVHAFEVIHDGGGIPAQPVIDAVLGAARTTESLPPPPDPGAFAPQPQYPIHSTRLQPGTWAGPPSAQVTARLAFFRTPIAVLGTDERSRAWLSMHRERLMQIGAVLLVVESPSAAATAELQALAPGLRVALAVGDGLVRTVGIEVYPVLLSARGIEQ